MLNIDETTDVSKSIVHLSNQIDHSLQLTNEDFIQSKPIDLPRENDVFFH